jgi:hypothetical protein
MPFVLLPSLVDARAVGEHCVVMFGHIRAHSFDSVLLYLVLSLQQRVECGITFTICSNDFVYAAFLFQRYTGELAEAN